MFGASIHELKHTCILLISLRKAHQLCVITTCTLKMSPQIENNYENHFLMKFTSVSPSIRNGTNLLDLNYCTSLFQTH